MSKKKFMLLSLSFFCLIAALLVGVTSSADYDPWCDVNCDGIIDIVDIVNLAIRFGEVGTPLSHAAVQFEGNISVPAAAFVPRWSNDSALNEGWELYNFEGPLLPFKYFFAPAQLPHGATITRVTFYWYDTGTSDILFYLQRYNQGTHGTMASLSSTGSAGHGSSFNTTIFNPNVDNNLYAYSMRLVIPYSASHVDYYFEYALIEYTYL